MSGLSICYRNQILIGNGRKYFKLSHVGFPCRTPISEMKVCQEAANLAKSVLLTADNITGLGAHLPYGCISDKVTPDVHYMYWNSNGSAKSADPNIRQICQEKQSSFEGS